MNNNAAKIQLSEKLTRLLNTTSALNIDPQQKLKILKVFIPSQISFQLRIVYDFANTWIEQTLDALVYNSVRDWMKYPISTCVKEFLALSKHQGGFDIPSRKSTAQKLRLNQRYMMKFNKNKDMWSIWSATSTNNVNSDYICARNLLWRHWWIIKDSKISNIFHLWIFKGKYSHTSWTQHQKHHLPAGLPR